MVSRDIVPICLGTSFHVIAFPACAAGSPARIQGQRPQELAVFGQHAHVVFRDEHEHAGAGELAAEPDVMQPGVVVERDDPR